MATENKRKVNLNGKLLVAVALIMCTLLLIALAFHGIRTHMSYMAMYDMSGDWHYEDGRTVTDSMISVGQNESITISRTLPSQILKGK